MAIKEEYGRLLINLHHLTEHRQSQWPDQIHLLMLTASADSRSIKSDLIVADQSATPATSWRPFSRVDMGAVINFTAVEFRTDTAGSGRPYRSRQSTDRLQMAPTKLISVLRIFF
jgi:hypothetical protein